MSNGTDRFFEEMLDSATRIAKKDVAKDMAALRAQIAPLKKQLATATSGLKAVTKRETEVAKREAKIDKQCTKSEKALKIRETTVGLAEKEIVHLLNEIDKITDETVETVHTTARRFVSRSTQRGFYGRFYPSNKASALSTVKRRVTQLIKKETESNE